MDAKMPVFKQIAVRIENDILTGTFPPGYRISPVRELAAQFRVNPNTAQRAVWELKQAGLLVSSRGKGTVVTNDVDFICRFRQKRCQELTNSFIRQMEMLGYSREQIKNTSFLEICEDKELIDDKF